MTLSSNNRRFDPSQTPSSQTDSLQLQRRQGNALNDITNNSQEYDSIESHAHSSTKPAQATTTTATTSTTATTVPAKKPSQPGALQQHIQAQLKQQLQSQLQTNAARGQQANITPEQIQTQTQAMVKAAAQAQAFVSAVKSRGDGLVPMTAQQITSLSKIQAQAIVNARPQTALLASGTPTVDKDGKPVQPTPAQIQHQITLQAQALVYAHTQAQIAAGIFKGDTAATSTTAAGAKPVAASSTSTASTTTAVTANKPAMTVTKPITSTTAVPAPVSKVVNRRGNPKMHKTVEARKADPSISECGALLKGGFKFPGYTNDEETLNRVSSDKKLFDDKGISMSQRKKQLRRRLRPKKEKASGSSSQHLSTANGTLDVNVNNGNSEGLSSSSHSCQYQAKKVTS